MVVRGGSVHGGECAVLQADAGGGAVAEGVVLQSRPVEGSSSTTCAALATGPGSSVVLRRCDLRMPSLTAPQPEEPTGYGLHWCLVAQKGARGTAAECSFGGRALAMDSGSSLLLSSFAFPPGLEDPIVTQGGGVARVLVDSAGVARRRAARG